MASKPAAPAKSSAKPAKEPKPAGKDAPVAAAKPPKTDSHPEFSNEFENRFGIEPEITAKVAGLGVRIYEVPVSYSGRTYAEGKKIDWKDGLSALRCIVKYNLLG